MGQLVLHCAAGRLGQVLLAQLMVPLNVGSVALQTGGGVTTEQLLVTTQVLLAPHVAVTAPM